MGLSLVSMTAANTCDEDFYGDGANYRGCKYAKTITGRECQPWNVSKPQIPKAALITKELGTDGTHNYCRNPDGEPTVWCYTMDPKKRWEICKEPICKEEMTGNGLDYRGCQTKTASGKSC